MASQPTSSLLVRNPPPQKKKDLYSKAFIKGNQWVNKPFIKGNQT